uniref:Thioesterase domain-containing protein n=1 Tax=Aegilops tauschii TaxID=37682 RepID=M8AIQ6_AEGTA
MAILLKTAPVRNSGNFLHGGATASLVDLVGTAVFYTAGAQTRGSPLEMNISYLDAAFSDEEIDIEAKVLRAGKAVGVATVELKKKSGKIIAQARYSKYLGASTILPDKGTVNMNKSDYQRLKTNTSEDQG